MLNVVVIVLVVIIVRVAIPFLRPFQLNTCSFAQFSYLIYSPSVAATCTKPPKQINEAAV
jgi:hypothetical protein